MRSSAGSGGVGHLRLELPAAISGADAKTLAEQALARRWLAADRVTLHLPPTFIDLRPGDALTLPGSARAWVARSVAIEGMAVTVEAEAAPVGAGSLPADPGRPVVEPDVPIGPSDIALFLLPPEAGLAEETSPAAKAPDTGNRALVAASGSGAWRPVAVELMLGDAPLPALVARRRAVLGRAETRLRPGIRAGVTVRLAATDQQLFNADEAAIAAGANLAFLGDELIQFGRAQWLAPGRYRLTGLLRERRGTAGARHGHRPGEPFCLVDGSLHAIALPAGATGATLSATVRGLGDAAPRAASRRLVGRESPH